jgi:hypothetical protein
MQYFACSIRTKQSGTQLTLCKLGCSLHLRGILFALLKRARYLFSKASKPVVGFTQPFIQWGTGGAFPRINTGYGAKRNPHLFLRFKNESNYTRTMRYRFTAYTWATYISYTVSSVGSRSNAIHKKIDPHV